MYGTKGIWIILIGIVLFSCCNQQSKCLRILSIFPINAKSHFIMFESLAKGLAAKGHQVDVYSQFPLKESIPNYKDYSLQGSLPSMQNNLTYNEAIQFQFLNMQFVINTIGTPVCEILSHPKFQDLLKNLHQDPPYDIVIVEAFLSNCHLAWGRYFNIPMVGLMTTMMLDWYHSSFGYPSNTALTHIPTDRLTNFQLRLSDTIFNTLINLMTKNYINRQHKYIKQYFGPDYPDPSELQKDIDLLLVNSHYSLEGIQANIPAIIPVAGLHIKDDNTTLTQEVQKWLDDSKNGCIYFSFGSMVRIETFPKSFLNILYTSFKNIAPIRVLMKITKSNELIPSFPSNVMTQSWFSQEQVLKHKNTKIFITHGGLMGTLESIYFGVPMIGIPIFGDQHNNMEINVNKGIAKLIKLENITEGGLTSAIKDILYNPLYKKNSEKVSKVFTDRPLKPLDMAVYWIEYISRHGKKSLRSPFVDMPWWQVASLDIYASILFILVVIFYFLKFVLKRIHNFWRSSWKKIIYSVSAKFKKIQ